MNGLQRLEYRGYDSAGKTLLKKSYNTYICFARLNKRGLWKKIIYFTLGLAVDSDDQVGVDSLQIRFTFLLVKFRRAGIVIWYIFRSN